MDNISNLFEAVDVREGNQTLNQLIHAKDQSHKLQESMATMFSSNLFASICAREPQYE